MRRPLWAALLLLFPLSAFADYTGTVRSIAATAKTVTVRLDVKGHNAPVALTTSSIVIEEAIVSAYFTAATITVETTAPHNVIKRVQAFEPGRPLPPPPGKYLVNRLATQRDQAGMDHLEVFLLEKNDTPEVQVNVFKRLLDPIFIAAFQARAIPAPVPAPPRVDVEYDETKSVTKVSIGVK